jgi:integrase
LSTRQVNHHSVHHVGNSAGDTPNRVFERHRAGDVKTPKSKRSLVLPKRAVAALQAHKKRQAGERLAAGTAWQDNNLVFCHEDGRMYTSDALNWRFGKMTRRAGIGHWHAHEGRHTAVSIMSSNGVPLQEISDTVGHKSTHVTETVYRHVIVVLSHPM